MTPADELAQLKKLLLTDEQVDIETLKSHVVDKSQRAKDIADVLAMAIRLAADRDDQLAKSLSHPLGLCFPQAVKKDAKVLADALAPIMGPATRRAITETLANFVQSINQVLDQSLTPKGISWRIEAWRTGVPFSEVVLKNTLLYRVDQLFVIHRETGLLICNVSHGDIETNDMDAVSAMLTAIQDFVKDSFKTDEHSELDTVDVGEQTIRLIRNSNIVLAAVIRGVVSQELVENLQTLIETIQLQYQDQIDAFDGDQTALVGLDDLLLDYLVDKRKPELESAQEQPLKRFIPWIVGILLALSSYGYFSYQDYVVHQQVNTLVGQLKKMPGWTVTAVDQVDNRYVIRGLRDPLAKMPPQWPNGESALKEIIDLEFVSFYSLDEAIVKMRLAKQLGQTPLIQYRYEQGTLSFNGQASSAWLNWLAQIKPFLVGVDAIDTQAVKLDDASIAQLLMATLNPPTTASLSVRDARVFLSGLSEYAWYLSLKSRWSELQSEYSLEPQVNIDDFTIEPRQRALRLINTLNSESIGFIDDQTLTQQGKVDTVRIAEIMGKLIEIDQEVNVGLQLILIGDSDGIGSEEKNQRVRQQRAEIAKKYLTELGVPEQYIAATIDPVFDLDGQKNLEKRRVKFSVQLTPFTWNES